MSDTREKLTRIVTQKPELLKNLNISILALQRFVGHLIDNGVTVQKWIPVTERLPEQDGIYLTFNKKKQYEFHFFQRGKRMWSAIWEEDAVTHWMPIPEPPKGE